MKGEEEVQRQKTKYWKRSQASINGGCCCLRCVLDKIKRESWSGVVNMSQKKIVKRRKETEKKRNQI